MDGMNTNWILGGILLLLGATILKTMQAKGTFQTLLMGFTFCWSTLVAIHLWWPAIAALEAAGLGGLEQSHLALAAYWCAALAAAIPGVALLFWLRGYQTTFPLLVDGALLWGTAILTAVWCACLVLMSLSLYAPAPNAGDSDEEATRVTHARAVLARMPPRLYLHLAAAVTRPEQSAARLARLPAAARGLLPP